MAITNPRVIAFMNERLRPVAERARGFRIEARDALDFFHNELGLLVPENNEIVEDGRDGISELDGRDVHNFAGVVESILAILELADNVEIVRKPCVRPIGA